MVKRKIFFLIWRLDDDSVVFSWIDGYAAASVRVVGVEQDGLQPYDDLNPFVVSVVRVLHIR